MKDALIKLSADNLANLVPHPIFPWFNYSHPPPVERIERLEKKGTCKLLLFNCGPVPNTFSQERSAPFALCPLPSSAPSRDLFGRFRPAPRPDGIGIPRENSEMRHALCTMLHALCAIPSALYPLLYAPCTMLHALCPLPYAIFAMS